MSKETEDTHEVRRGSSLASRLRFAVMLSAVVLLMELIGGFLANSLALLSDAGHVFTDVVALSLSWFAVRQADRPANARMTYGYHRIGVLVAVVNAVTIIGISGFIFYEAYHRLQEPPEVRSVFMLSVAVVGFIANLIVVRRLYADQRRSLNIRSAFLHALGDALASIGVIVGGIIIAFTDWFWIDPVVSIFIGLIIAFAAWGIIKEATEIFLEASPRFLDTAELASAMCRVTGVQGVHDLHTWSITPQIHALSCHVVIDDLLISEGAGILEKLNTMLRERFSIEHATVQIEHIPCTDDALHCSIAPEEDVHHH